VSSRCVDLVKGGALVAALACALAEPAVAAATQQHLPPAILSDEPGVASYDVRESIRQSRSQFRLLGEGDRAWTSLRGAGSNILYTTNTGPLDDIHLDFFNGLIQTGTAAGTWFQTFGMGLIVGAPRTEWVRLIAEGATSLRNARGGGWTVRWNGDIFAFKAAAKDLNAADGLLGSLLNPAARTTTDGSCLDHSGFLGAAGFSAGFQLLPGSNCPPTWSLVGGQPTWLGTRPVTPDGWVAYLNAVGPAAFEFNDWQVPEAFRDPIGFLGNNFHTYGHFNDYNSTVIARFGNAVPGGSGDPTQPGWPLGLDFYFDAFTFSLPTVANTMFYRVLIVNNTRALYGVPHDYDSLYIGIEPWPGRQQDGDNYMIPALGAWVSSESSPPAECAAKGVDPIPLLGTGCGGFAPADDGFRKGAHAVVVLKSPIGDLRNKLFTRPGSPFFGAGRPEIWDDTITFNHSVNWNFGNWAAFFQGGSVRSQFGVISSTAENVLDGRACTDLTLSTRYRLFMSNSWPDAATQCVFKAWAPGWTYDTNRPRGAPPGPDTLRLAGCGVRRDGVGAGCPVPWSDSTVHGWSNVTFGNLSQLSVGPFRLEAGDTAQFFVAIFSQRDSASFESELRAIVDFYLNLFAGPEPPPRVTIRDVGLGAGVTPGRDATVRLVWDDAPEVWVDPFLSRFADDMESAAPGTDLARIRDQNPGLVARIRARAADNLARLLLFKSCDGGTTFTSDGDCDGDPAVDERGNAIGVGWEAYAIFEPDASGDVPNTFVDAEVTPGVTYLYVLLGETRGAEFTVIDDPNATFDGSGNLVCPPTGCQVRTFTIAPKLLNPLSRSAGDPNVVSVYVPASSGAGGVAASVEFVSRDPVHRSTAPLAVNLLAGSIDEQEFRIVFGNRIRVTEERDAAEDTLIRTTVEVEDVANTVVGDTGTVVSLRVLNSESFVFPGSPGVTMQGLTLVSDVTAGGVRTRVFERGPTSLVPDGRFASGFVLVRRQTGVPLLASGTLTGDAATPGGFLSRPDFPGFIISADNASPGSLQRTFYLAANGDTIAAAVQPSLTYNVALSSPRSVQGRGGWGEYRIRMAGPLFGPLAPFTLNFTDPAQTDATFDQSLAQRAVGTTGATDDATRDLIAALLGQPPAAVQLVAARIPFTVENLSRGRTARLAMVNRDTLRIRLGFPTGRDTLTVTVAPEFWVPSDALYVIETVTRPRVRTVSGTPALVVNESGQVVEETSDVVTVGPLVLTCANPLSCNPVRGPGFGGWVDVNTGDEFHVVLRIPFQPGSEYRFIPHPAIQGQRILADGRSIRAALDSVRVVPNPYLFFSAYEQSPGQVRLLFTHLPPEGKMRIYTVAGRFVQELSWDPTDLTANGDLFWDMTTREGNEIAAGLYIFVVEARDPATGQTVKKAGKFVVIR
jgi:hypothetical protein